MKQEPTVATAVTIYHLIDLELKDLDADDMDGCGLPPQLLRETADGILDELDGIFYTMQQAGTERFTGIYKNAERIAGLAVRLAAIARRGIIDTEGGDGGNG